MKSPLGPARRVAPASVAPPFIARGFLALWLVAACLVTTDAPAQEASGKWKGKIGGGLLGAEVVLMTEAALGVRAGWAYLAGGLGGAALGGAAGHLLEKDTGPRPPLYLLSASFALVIPTFLVVLNAQTFEPPATYRHETFEPTELDDELHPEARRTGHDAARRALRDDARSDDASRRSASSGIALGVPVVGIKPTFDPDELFAFGVAQRLELHVTLLNGAF